MRVSVADITEQVGLHKRFDLQIELEPVEINGTVHRFDQPFKGQAELWNSGEEILVKARLEGEAEVPCSRCLTSFQLPIRVAFQEVLREGAPPAPGSKEAEAADELQEHTVTYYEGDEVDLSEPLRENVLLELPMKPLCSDLCKGLCPSCGQNLNEGPCQCKHENQPDPRLAKLRDLLPGPETNS